MEFVKDQNKHRPPWEINTPNNTETLLLWLSFFTYLYTLNSLVVRLKVPYSKGNYSLSLNYNNNRSTWNDKERLRADFFAEDCINIQRYKVKKNKTTPKTFWHKNWLVQRNISPLSINLFFIRGFNITQSMYVYTFIPLFRYYLEVWKADSKDLNISTQIVFSPCRTMTR